MVCVTLRFVCDKLSDFRMRRAALGGRTAGIDGGRWSIDARLAGQRPGRSTVEVKGYRDPAALSFSTKTPRHNPFIAATGTTAAMLPRSAPRPVHLFAPGPCLPADYWRAIV